MPNNSPPGLRTAANVPPVDSLCPARTFRIAPPIPAPGLARWAEPFAHCDHCRRDFFPQSRALGIDQSSLSPGFLRKVIATATRCRSFLDADDLLRELSGLDLGPKQIERLVHKIGQERVDERDEAVERFKQLPLAEKFAVPQGVTAPEVAVVMTDGGRYQMRFPSRSADANPVGTVDAPASGAARRGPGDHPSYGSHPGRDGRSGESDALA